MDVYRNIQLLETHWGIEKMWQHSCGTVLPANHVSIGLKHLRDVSSSSGGPTLPEAPSYTIEVVG